MTYKQKRRMESIVSQISAEAHLEASTLHSKESLLKIASSKAEGISALIEEKSASLAQALQDVEGLKTRLSELNLSISETAKTKGQPWICYDMGYSHHYLRLKLRAPLL